MVEGGWQWALEPEGHGEHRQLEAATQPMYLPLCPLEGSSSGPLDSPWASALAPATALIDGLVAWPPSAPDPLALSWEAE